MTVAAILLAGGESSRMGQPKVLLPWGDQTLVEHQIDQLRRPPVERVVVVLGHDAEQIRPVVERAGAEVLVNELYKRGRASSLRAGARAVADDTRTIVVLDVDQPRPRRVIQRLIENHLRASNMITVPTFDGKRGHPTVVDGWLLPELRRRGGWNGRRRGVPLHDQAASGAAPLAFGAGARPCEKHHARRVG